MKISIIHNLYHLNPHVKETVTLNIKALNTAGVDYEYILFNDNGDHEIYNDIKSILDLNNPRIMYIYSDINYGKKVCTGGWVGALEYVTGDLIQNIGQDDVMSDIYYTRCLKYFELDPDLNLVFTNAFRVSDKLVLQELLMNPQYNPDYSKSIDRFKEWFGVNENGQIGVTRANNNMSASGVIYKKKLHKDIGIPDLNFGGACDFEYWARILFNNKKCKFINEPLWLYRMSNYSSGNEIVDGKPNRGYWQQLHIKEVQEKYTNLWEKRIMQENVIKDTIVNFTK